MQTKGAGEEVACLLMAARHEIKQLRSQLVLLRSGDCSLSGSASGACELGDPAGHRSKAAVLDEFLSVPVICLLQVLCLLGLFALHAWPNMF